MRELKVALFLAIRSVARAQKSASVLLVFILFLSFLNLMFITGILAGLSAAIIRQSVETTSSYIDIDPQQSPTQQIFIADQRDLRTRIESLPGVIATSRHYALGGSMAYDREKNGHVTVIQSQILGIDPEDEKRVTTISQYMVSGEYLDTTHQDEIMLGADVAGGYGASQLDSLGGAKIGDKVTVTYPSGAVRTYRIKGIYKVGFFSGFAFITSKEAESVLNVSNFASKILINVDPAYQPLAEYVDEFKQVAPTLKISTYIELLGQIQPISLAFDAISFIVSAVSVMVAAITIFVLIYVNALNKRRQIGILKAIGIRQRIIILSYMYQSVFFSGCGVALGTATVFLIFVPLLEAHPFTLPLGRILLTYSRLSIMLSISSVLLAGVISGVIPSWRVARQNIIAAIWGA